MNDQFAGVISLSIEQDDPAPDSFVDHQNLHVVSYMQLDAGSRDRDMRYCQRINVRAVPVIR
jgi:hypothetical protein